MNMLFFAYGTTFMHCTILQLKLFGYLYTKTTKQVVTNNKNNETRGPHVAAYASLLSLSVGILS